MDRLALVNRKPPIISVDRRTFLTSSGTAVFGALLPRISRFFPASNTPEPFAWKTSDLTFSFDVVTGKLRQKRLVPAGVVAGVADNSSGVEIALQCSGENSPDQGMKSGMGQPGFRLLFAGKREETTHGGKRLVCMHTDPVLNLRVESVYGGTGTIPRQRRKNLRPHCNSRASSTIQQVGSNPLAESSRSALRHKIKP
jgi:hypothetical protein